MRVAALYDIHGNLAALDAVLAELEDEAVELVVVGGDVAAGPFPAACWDRARELGSRAVTIRGNAERELVECRARLAAGTAIVDPSDPWSLRDHWVAGELSRAQLDAMAELAPTAVADGVLYCHGSPRRDDEIITAYSPLERVRAALEGVRERLVVIGHTHVQFERVVAQTRLVNAGSVGLPYGEPGAYWLLIDDGEVEWRRTPYDVAAAAAAIRLSGFPEAGAYADDLLAPASAEEALAFFEQLPQTQ